MDGLVSARLARLAGLDGQKREEWESVTIG